MSLQEPTAEPNRRPRSKKNNPPTPATMSEMIVRLHGQYPNDSRETGINRFVQTCTDAGLFHSEALEYFARFNWNVLTTAKTQPSTEKQQEAKENAKHAIKIMADYSFLRALMPNGKTGRNCTGKDLIEMGGGYARIGQALKPKQKMSALPEDEIQKLYKGDSR